METDCTANGVFRYDHRFNTVHLSDWVQIVDTYMCKQNINWKTVLLHPGTLNYDGMCMSIGRLFQNLTFDVEVGANIVYEAWIENYIFYMKNKPSTRREKKTMHQSKYTDLSEDEKEKNLIITRFIINDHINYQQFVNSFTPQKLEELEEKTPTFRSSLNPLSVQPTIIVNDTIKNIFKKTISAYKLASGNDYIYDYGNLNCYLGPTSQVMLTTKYHNKLVGARGVVISVDEVQGEELPLVRFLEGEDIYVNYVDGRMPLMMASFLPLTSDIKFKLEMCLIDGDLIKLQDMSRALEKARTFDCVEVKNMPSWTPCTVLDLIIDVEWKRVLNEAFEYKQGSEFLKAFSSRLLSEYDRSIMLPPKNEIFAALNAVSFEDVKVVIIGNETYNNPKKAHGLSFSSDDLIKWGKHGVLLLNTSLSTLLGKINSHMGKGWERIINEIIQQINARKDNIVFILWGALAQKKCTFIDVNRHCVLDSPLDYECFCDVNNYLRKKGVEEINWEW